MSSIAPANWPISHRCGKGKWLKLRARALRRAKWRCESCGHKPQDLEDRTGNYLTCDHVTPLVLGGRNHLNNLQILCLVCHCLKDHDRIPIRFVPYVGRPDAEPTRVAMLPRISP